MHFSKSSAIHTILAVLVCMMAALTLFGHLPSTLRVLPNQITELSDGWYYLANDQRIDVTLPAVITLDSDEDLILYCDSLTADDAEQILSTRGALYRLTISVNGCMLYQYDDSAFPRNDQMSSKVNCTAALPASYEGETVALTFQNTKGRTFHVQKVYVGEAMDIFFFHCSQNAALLLIIFIMAILAVITIYISFYLRHLQVQEKRFFDIACFLFFCVCWFLTDSSLAQLVSSHSSVILYISFYAFMLFSIPMLSFMKHTEGLKEYRSIDLLISLFYANALLQSVLNYFGLYCFVDMLFLTHTLLFGGVALLLFLLIKSYRTSKNRELLSILIAFAVLGSGGLLSLMLYWVLKVSFYEVFFELGIVIFIILLIRMLIIAMVDNLRFRTEAEIYQRLAGEDSMTGMKNRRSFDEAVSAMEEHISSYHNLYLIFMDLNQLKNINDTFGHHTGDELIIAAARCIEKAFGSMGTCYRIGGDEFCAVLPNISLSEQQLSEKLDEEIRFYNSICSKFRISLARGISNIRNEDGSLKTVSDWKSDADLKMYQNKGWIKRVR